MHSTAGLWHPISEGKLYEAAGSRTNFNNKWSRQTWHYAEPKPSQDEIEELRNDLNPLQSNLAAGS